MDKKELALSLHDKGYNCAQSVACAFSAELGINEDILFAACEGLGFGMGSSEEVCGALSGAVILAGLKNSDKDTNSPKTKKETYALASEIREYFKLKSKSTICKDIKGIKTGNMLCSCADCIKAGVEAAEKVLKI